MRGAARLAELAADVQRGRPLVWCLPPLQPGGQRRIRTAAAPAVVAGLCVAHDGQWWAHTATIAGGVAQAMPRRHGHCGAVAQAMGRLLPQAMEAERLPLPLPRARAAPLTAALLGSSSSDESGTSTSSDAAALRRRARQPREGPAAALAPREWRHTVRLAVGILKEVGSRSAAQRGRLLRARQGPGPDTSRALRRAQAASAAAAENPSWEEERRRIDAAAWAALGTDGSSPADSD